MSHESQPISETDDLGDSVPIIEGADEGDAQQSPPHEGVSIEKSDRSLSELHRWYKSKRLIIDPEWQRNYVWDNKRASKLIESFLMDIPVPVVYLARTEQGNYEVIDGVQRLTSVFRFIDGQFALGGLELLPEHNKVRFAALPVPLKSKLEDTTVRTFELSPKTSKSLLFIIFERLNTGGIALNEMEIRNCVYRGKLNDLIKKLASYPQFLQCVSQRNLSKRMGDRSLVLRFLAFYEKGYTKAQSGLKGFLNDFFETYRNPPEKKLEEFEKKFQTAMRSAHTIFGNQGFRLRSVDSKGAGEWTPNVNASIFQCIGVSLTKYDQAQITERADAIVEEYLDLLASDVQWRDSVTKSTGDATKITYAFETWMERLSKVMEGAMPLDPTRVFSKALKEEMWRASRTCAICQQEIKLVTDGALDHDEHYWRAGKTIPSNARLVHRICNQKRAK
jgi:hypothetical protein